MPYYRGAAMSDDENKGKSDFSDALSRLEKSSATRWLGGLLAIIATLAGVANKYFPELIPSASNPLPINLIQEQERQIKSLLREVSKIQTEEFESFHGIAQELETGRRGAEQNPNRLARLLEIEQRYRRQNKVVKDLMIDWDKPDRGFLASLDRYSGAFALTKSGRPGEAENGLIGAIADLTYLKQRPERTKQEIADRERETIMQLQRLWGDDKTCSRKDLWQISESRVLNDGKATQEKAIDGRDDWRISEYRISIDGKEAREKIIGVRDDKTIETVVEMPKDQQGKVYRYALDDTGLQAENLSTGEKGRFTSCQ
jgi:hypothetical protein